MNTRECVGITSQIAGGSCQEGARANPIASAVMVQGDGNLNEGLEEFFFGCVAVSGAPDVLKHFMGLKEFVAVEQLDSLPVPVVLHLPILA